MREPGTGDRDLALEDGDRMCLLGLLLTGCCYVVRGPLCGSWGGDEHVGDFD